MAQRKRGDGHRQQTAGRMRPSEQPAGIQLLAGRLLVGRLLVGRGGGSGVPHGQSGLGARRLARTVVEHRDDLIVVRAGVGQPLEHQHHRRVTGWVGDGEVGQRRLMHRLVREVHRSHQHGVRVAGAKGAGGELEGDQTGGLLRTDRETGAGQAELRVDPVGDDVGHGAEHTGRGLGRPHRVADRVDQAGIGRHGVRGEPCGDPPAGHIAGHLRIGAHADEHHGPVRGQSDPGRGIARRRQDEHLLWLGLRQVDGGEAQPVEPHLDGGAPRRTTGAGHQRPTQIVGVPAVRDHGPDRDDGDRRYGCGLGWSCLG